MIDCIFCKIIRGEIPSERLYEDETTFAFLDIKPLNDGHTLVVPKTHYENIFDAAPGALDAVMRIVQKLAPVIRDTVGAAGMNVNSNHGTAAGQLVPHLHIHLIPRFADDGYRHWHRETPTTPLAEVRQRITDAIYVAEK